MESVEQEPPASSYIGPVVRTSQVNMRESPDTPDIFSESFLIMSHRVHNLLQSKIGVKGSLKKKAVKIKRKGKFKLKHPSRNELLNLYSYVKSGYDAI